MGSERKYTTVFRAKIPALNLKLNLPKMLLRLHENMYQYAILEKQSKINFEQKQDVSAALMNLLHVRSSFGYWTKILEFLCVMTVNVGNFNCCSN